jgi:hypothetical protein
MSTAVCKDLIKRLLTERRQRLDLKGIKKHAWFATMDWARLESRGLPAPYVPDYEPVSPRIVSDDSDRITLKEKESPMSLDEQQRMMTIFKNF